VPDFAALEEPFGQLRRVIGIASCGGARFVLPWHDRLYRNDGTLDAQSHRKLRAGATCGIFVL
jgi:hypothetical protein